MTHGRTARTLALLGLVALLAGCEVPEPGASILGAVGLPVVPPMREVEEVANASAPERVAPGERVDVELAVAFPDTCGAVGKARAIVDEARRTVAFRVERRAGGWDCQPRPRLDRVTASFVAGPAGEYTLDLLIAPVTEQTNPRFLTRIPGPRASYDPFPSPGPDGSPAPTGTQGIAARPAAARRTTLIVTVAAPSPSPTPTP